jgi:hypothetical protein
VGVERYGADVPHCTTLPPRPFPNGETPRLTIRRSYNDQAESEPKIKIAKLTIVVAYSSHDTHL